MRLGLINNLSTELAADVTSTDTTLDIADQQLAIDLISILQDVEAVVITVFTANDRGEELTSEIMHVVASSPPTLTVARGQENTTPLDFPVGAKIEARLTAGVLTTIIVPSGDSSGDQAIAIGDGSEASGPYSLAAGYKALALQDPADSTPPSGSTAIGLLATAEGDGALAIGGSNAFVSESGRTERGYSKGAYAKSYMAIAIGAGSQAEGNSSVAINTYSYATGYGSIAISEAAEATAGQTIALGPYAKSTASDAITIGAYSETTGSTGVTLGVNASNGGEGAVCLGPYTATNTGTIYSVAIGESALVDSGSNNVAIGERAAVGGVYATAVGGNSWAPGEGSIALGAGAYAAVPSGCRITGIQYLPKLVETDASLRPGSYYNPTSNAFNHVADAALRTSGQITLATDALDLTVVGSTYTLSLPVGTMMFIDALDIIVVGADGAGGASEIQVGADASTPANYLAATPITSITVGGREVHESLTTGGVTSLRAEVVTAGTGTDYKAKVVARGYVMEI